MLYNVNDQLVPRETATVSVEDRGFLYGDAAFETIRVYGGTPFAWDRHVHRLFGTCHLLGIEHELTKKALRSRLDETLNANDLEEAYVRLSITRGVQPGKLTPGEEVDPTVVFIVKPLPRGGSNGTVVWDAPAATRIVETMRIPDACIPVKAKTHNYLNGILARLELRGTTADEALLLNADGQLTEGTTCNVFCVTDGVIRTPPVSAGLLPGITRETTIALAKTNEIPIETETIAPADLEHATEVFLTNSTWEIRPVATVGESTYDTGPVTTQLMEQYATRIERTHYT